jgi:protein Mpv17
MSSVIVDDVSDASNPPSHQPVVPPSVSQEEQTSRQWVNNGLTIGTLVALVACLSFSMEPAVLGDRMAHAPTFLWEHYSAILTEHPIATKAVTSATVYTIGDVIAQKNTPDFSDLDYGRIARSMLAGLIGHGPLSHVWYNVCDGFFADTLHLSTVWWAFLPKVVVDQAIWGPIWNNTYLLLIGLMKRERLDVIWDDVRKSTLPMVLSGLKLWPAAHLVTYGLIPVEHRLLWVDAVEIIWVTVLSTQAASLGAASHDREEDSVALSSSN